jgi:polysaccharide pyruvyl transferase WcaK-like protein
VVSKSHASSPRRIFIVGWYGTETVGDKAILGGILDHYQQKYQNPQFIISSLHPFITHQTMRELGQSARIVPAFSWRFIRTSATSHEVVMGGGPLMDLSSLSIPLWAFMIARWFRRRRVVFGCGLGPLTQPHYIESVRRILKLSTTILVRDSDSVQFAKTLSGREDVEQIDDPAKSYLLNKYSAVEKTDQRVVACFLRDWPRNYAPEVTDEEYQTIKDNFEQQLATFLATVSQKYDLRLVFYAMHTFTVGNDDRAFNRRFIAERLPKNIDATYEMRSSSVDSIVEAMQSAQFCICMRYHSVLFAHIVQKNYIAIDYTLGGKIKGFLEDEGAMSQYCSLQSIANGEVDAMNSLTEAFMSL